MNFQFNPWVDPRVEKVLMFHLETYLRRKGWKEGKSKVSPMRAETTVRLSSGWFCSNAFRYLS